MQNNMKRILIILAAIVVIIGLGIAAYFLFFSGSAPKLTGSDTPNPFSDIGSASAVPNQTVSNPTGSAGTEVAPHLVKITDGPVAIGVSVFDTSIPGAPVASGSATSTAVASSTADVSVRYIERASGNVYNYLVHARTLTRLSNRTLPGIQEASWLTDGSLAYVRFLYKDGATEHLKTYALPANGIGGFFLEDDLADAFAVGSSGVFSQLASTDGTTGTLAHSDGTSVHTFFTSLLSQLTVTQGGGAFFATTKPSSGLQGYGFSISPSGSLTRILGPAAGLTLLPSPSGKSVLYSYVQGKTAHLGVMDVATRTQTPLPLATFTEKCVWGTDNLTAYCAVPTTLSGNLPDDWYQGAVSFTDRIWKIDMVGRVATLVVDPSTVAKVQIDAIGLALDAKNDALIFTDKTTNSLWSYDL